MDPSQPQGVLQQPQQKNNFSLSFRTSLLLFFVFGSLFLIGGMYVLPTVDKKVPQAPSTAISRNIATPFPSFSPQKTLVAQTLPVTPTTAQITASASGSVNGVDCGSLTISLFDPTVTPMLYSNPSCFKNLAQTCTPSHLEVTTQLSSMGFSESASSEYAIQGMQDGKCALHVKQGPISFVFPTGIPESEQQVDTQGVQKSVGKEGTCLFSSNADLVNYLTTFSGQSSASAQLAPNGSAISYLQFGNGQCTGDYFIHN